MCAEYVKIHGNEIEYAMRKMLEGQLSMLNFIKIFSNYKKLRSNELSQKINLKAKVSSLNETMILLEKLLPRDPIQERKQAVAEQIIPVVEEKEEDRNSIEWEIDSIKRKLAALR